MRRAKDQRIGQIPNINETAQIAHRGQRQGNPLGEHLEHLDEIAFHACAINQRRAHDDNLQAGFLRHLP